MAKFASQRRNNADRSYMCVRNGGDNYGTSKLCESKPVFDYGFVSDLTT